MKAGEEEVGVGAGEEEVDMVRKKVRVELGAEETEAEAVR